MAVRRAIVIPLLLLCGIVLQGCTDQPLRPERRDDLIGCTGNVPPDLASLSDLTEAKNSRPQLTGLMRELLEWIGQNTAYDISKSVETLPDISFCRASEKILYEGRTIIVDEHLRAAYDLDARRIFLVDPWRVTDAMDVSTLLHELIHDVQFANRDWACIQQPEWEAYKLQEKWLVQKGFQPDFDWLRIQLISKCRRDVHP